MELVAYPVCMEQLGPVYMYVHSCPTPDRIFMIDAGALKVIFTVLMCVAVLGVIAIIYS